LAQSEPERDMNTKISSDRGYSIITDRANEADFKVTINHVSSTESQPYIGVNFTHDGKIVGGRTLTEGYVERMVAKAVEMGWKVEQL
jgi:hypothetical protein